VTDYTVDFPTLGDIGDAWLEHHASVPKGFDRGKPFHQSDWQFWCLANHYRIREEAQWQPERPLLNEAFVYRRSQIVGPQKIGKGPWSAGVVMLEAVGPSLFAGWAGKDDGYACSDFGCSCGWEYEYLPGEPMGMRQPSPLIQLTAMSEDQVGNVYDPLKAMIRTGPLADLLLIRDGFIRIVSKNGDPDLDRIERVTSAALSRLGNPISFALQDESGTATKSNKMRDVYETQRRGAAGMRGRTMETTNAWNPAENSVAQTTWESKAKDVFKFFRQPPAHLSFRNKAERRKIFQIVYAGTPWVSIDSIEADAAELMERDPSQAERFFGNKLVAGDGAYLQRDEWRKRAADGQDGRRQPITVKPRTKVGLGFDGSDNEDHTGIRLETLDQHQFTPLYGPNKLRAHWVPAEHGGTIPRLDVMQAFDDIMREFDVVRAYLDPPMWTSEIDRLAARYGEKIFIKWPTYRPGPMSSALDRFRVDIRNPDSPFSHDGDSAVEDHIANAIVRASTLSAVDESGDRQRRYKLGKPPGEEQKIDLAMSSILAHEAVMDALADGLATAKPKHQISNVMYGFN
jgi:hypothetical protein